MSSLLYSETASDLQADGIKERWGAELPDHPAGAAGHHRNNGLLYPQQVPFQVGTQRNANQPFELEIDTELSDFCL